MTEFDPAMVERLRVILFGNPTFGTDTAVEALRIRAALGLIGASPEALNKLWSGDAHVVETRTGRVI